MSIELSPLTILATVALGLLVAVTVGVIYLTTIEWRDRRWQEREKRDQKTQKRSSRR